MFGLGRNVTLALVGWLWADLLLGMFAIFLAANTTSSAVAHTPQNAADPQVVPIQLTIDGPTLLSTTAAAQEEEPRIAKANLAQPHTLNRPRPAPKSAARAAGRIRVPDIGLSPEERNEARFARATLGRAMRDARVRSFRAPIVRPAPQRVEIAPSGSSRRRLTIGTALAVALAL